MRKYVFISIGGFLGAVLRFLIKGMPIYGYSGHLPLNTLIINVTGSFILALILTIAFEIYDFNADIRLGIATGFLGAFTTFSTLCKEAAGLILQGYYFWTVAYIAISVMLGIAAAYLAIILTREVVSKIVKKQKGSNILEEDIGEIEEGVK